MPPRGQLWIPDRRRTGRFGERGGHSLEWVSDSSPRVHPILASQRYSAASNESGDHRSTRAAAMDVSVCLDTSRVPRLSSTPPLAS